MELTSNKIHIFEAFGLCSINTWENNYKFQQFFKQIPKNHKFLKKNIKINRRLI